MYHRLENVAFNRRLDKDKFVAFCEQNADRFLVNGMMVSTWYVDELVAEYREFVENE